MLKQLFFSFFFILCSMLIAQSSFKKLSRPEKIWVMCHPFKAKKTFKLTKEVQKVIDSIKQTGIIGVDNNGGKLDAFKHAYWMASLSNVIGKRKAKKLGMAHENGNYLTFKKHKLEDCILPDSLSSEMDLKNNEIGISLMNDCGKLPPKLIQDKVLTALEEGKLFIIKKDKNGKFLKKDGTQITINEWFGIWDIPKYLVPSNEE